MSATPVVRARVLTTARRAYRAVVITISEEHSDSSPRRDSTQVAPRLQLSVQAVPGGSYALQLQSEAWRSPASGPVPTGQKTVLLPVRLLLDSLGMHATAPTAGTPACTAGAEMFSPLGTRLLVVPGLLPASARGVLQDSLSYRTCANGTVLETNAILEYRGTGRGTEPTESAPVEVSLRGTIRADSTRALPMRLQGSLTGKALISPDTGNGALATLVTGDLVVTLIAESSVKRQEFRQRVNMRISLLPADSLR